MPMRAVVVSRDEAFVASVADSLGSLDSDGIAVGVGSAEEGAEQADGSDVWVLDADTVTDFRSMSEILFAPESRAVAIVLCASRLESEPLEPLAKVPQIELLDTGSRSAIRLRMAIERAMHRAATTKRLAAEALQWNRALDENVDGIMVLGEDGEILYANQTAASMFGAPRKQLLGTSFGRPSVAGDRTEVQLLPPGKGAAVAEMRAVDIVWKGKPASLASFRDVTARKRAEEQLRENVAELQRLNDELDAFVHTVSHDLSEPLRSVSQFSRLLIEEELGRLSEQGKEDLQRVHLAAMRARGYVRDLLTLSRIARETVTPEGLPLSTIVSQATQSLNTMVVERGARVICKSPDLVVPATPTLASQIFGNLISNAISHNPDARPEVVVDGERADGKVIVRVSDNGPGIEAGARGVVFDLFRRGPQAQGEGTGAGLAIARKAAVRLGGALEYDGEAAEGATFVLTLPARNLVPERTRQARGEGS